ncbi:unnamed protein product [Phyllotreta striolata]|uniref:Ribonuclease P protein subunit p29 n=1 Tax=Phyllotreta striolata TaxID=444603 RepID=A0A9N9TB16_PHYSR|nr:unnamed protein product [Phyllotreta striolata]
METPDLKTAINRPLPSRILDLPRENHNQSLDGIKNMLFKTVPKVDRQNFTETLKWKLNISKFSVKKISKGCKKKKPYLTREQRKKLNLAKLPNEGWNYSELENLRQMWKSYMIENLNIIGKPLINHLTPNWAGFSAVFAKSELIGAEITVVRSKNPNLIGLTGTVVLETKMTFQIVSPDSKLKKIPRWCTKNTSIKGHATNKSANKLHAPNCRIPRIETRIAESRRGDRKTRRRVLGHGGGGAADPAGGGARLNGRRCSRDVMMDACRVMFSVSVCCSLYFGEAAAAVAPFAL